MGRHDIAVVVLTELLRVEADGTLFLAVHEDSKAFRFHLCDGSHIPIRDSQLLVQRGKLELVSGGKLAAGLPKHVHTVDTLRIVGDDGAGYQARR